MKKSTILNKPEGWNSDACTRSSFVQGIIRHFVLKHFLDPCWVINRCIWSRLVNMWFKLASKWSFVFCLEISLGKWVRLINRNTICVTPFLLFYNSKYFFSESFQNSNSFFHTSRLVLLSLHFIRLLLYNILMSLKIFSTLDKVSSYWSI